MKMLAATVMVACAAANGALESATEWREGEQRVVAYVAPELHRIGELLAADTPELEDALDALDRDPLGSSPVEGAGLKLERLETPPQRSRFFQEGDVLWDVTASFREANVTGAGDGWAVYNDTTRRLVLRGTRDEHAGFELLQWRILDDEPRHLELRAALLKVRSRESDGVEWTAELVADRRVKELFAVTARSRPGRVAEVKRVADGYEVAMEAEMNVGAQLEVIDLRLEVDARLGQALGGGRVRLHTGLTLYGENPVYVEVGSKDDAEHALVFELRAEVQLADRTPRSRWQEFEDPRHQPPVAVRHDDGEHIEDLGDGFALGRWTVPPTFVESLVAGPHVGGDGADPDPFGVDEDVPEGADGADAAREAELRLPRVEAPEGIAGFWSGDEILDIGELMRDSGIEIVGGGWVFYVPRLSQVLARLDAPNLDLMSQILDGG